MDTGQRKLPARILHHHGYRTEIITSQSTAPQWIYDRDYNQPEYCTTMDIGQRL
jgi:hypothetical protein